MDLVEKGRITVRSRRKAERDFDSLVLDILCAEKDIFKYYRDDYKLYVKDGKGKFIQVAEFFQPEVNKIVAEIFRKQKLKYAITFLESIPILTTLKPYSLKILFLFVRIMRRNNDVPVMSLIDINDKTGISARYITRGINQLLNMDIVRRQRVKNSYEYMVNPAFFTKSTLRSVFTVTEKYSNMKPHLKKEYDFLNFDME